MVHITNTISVNTSPDTVFAFLANPGNLPLWNYYVVSVNKVSPGKPIIGSQYQLVRKKDNYYFEYTGFVENEFLEFTGIRNSFVKFKRRMSFSANDNSCIINDLFELGSVIPSFLLRLFTKKLHGALYENLLKLKQLLETGETVLQDGRKVSIR